MEVTIVGTGGMAKGIATRLLAGAHSISLIGIDAEEAREREREFEGRVELVDEPRGEVVVLAVPYGALQDVLGRHGGSLSGRIVVDISNPVAFPLIEPLSVEGSAAEEVAASVPDAMVVKAFNTTFAPTLITGSVDGTPLDVLLAGDDADAKAVLSRLVEDGGMRPIDIGMLVRSRQLEALGFLHISLQESLTPKYMTACKLLGLDQVRHG